VLYQIDRTVIFEKYGRPLFLFVLLYAHGKRFANANKYKNLKYLK